MASQLRLRHAAALGTPSLFHIQDRTSIRRGYPHRPVLFVSSATFGRSAIAACRSHVVHTLMKHTAPLVQGTQPPPLIRPSGFATVCFAPVAAHAARQLGHAPKVSTDVQFIPAAIPSRPVRQRRNKAVASSQHSNTIAALPLCGASLAGEHPPPRPACFPLLLLWHNASRAV